MANIHVYLREHGSSKIYPVERAKGCVGSYGIRWYEGNRQRQKIIGQYPATKMTKRLICVVLDRGQQLCLSQSAHPLRQPDFRALVCSLAHNLGTAIHDE